MTLHAHNCNKPDLFIEEYQRLFHAKQPKRLLEIGVQTGNSLRMWADAFPEAKIVGLDVNPMNGLVPTNVQFINGDQTDVKLLKSLGDFDVIIDDGSHMSADQQLTFEQLFSQLNSGGIYVIEDLEPNRQKEFKNSPLSTVEYFAEMTKPRLVSNALVPAFLHEGIRTITFADNLLIIHKA